MSSQEHCAEPSRLYWTLAVDHPSQRAPRNPQPDALHADSTSCSGHPLFTPALMAGRLGVSATPSSGYSRGALDSSLSAPQPISHQAFSIPPPTPLMPQSKLPASRWALPPASVAGSPTRLRRSNKQPHFTTRGNHRAATPPPQGPASREATVPSETQNFHGTRRSLDWGRKTQCLCDGFTIWAQTC